ncbi:hypothetical protein Scep_005245 [Stephania cephalantha]|uniref:Uncharacterized protein n=1 Tax=Stephania cephalantha TaxID=152367 RepID=A0AAP0KU65_9MAGN
MMSRVRDSHPKSKRAIRDIAKKKKMTAKKHRSSTNLKIVILRRLREHFLYSKLRSLLPPPDNKVPNKYCQQASSREIVLEKDEVGVEVGPVDGNGGCDEELRSVTVEFENEASAFVPTIDMVKMEGSIFVSTVALKDVALTSALFRILEEGRLDVVFENQSRTGDKVAHIFQVRVEQGFDGNDFANKLCKWARGAGT